MSTGCKVRASGERKRRALPALEMGQGVIQELEPQIMEAAIDTVVKDTGSEELSAEDKEEAEWRMNRVRQALTNILRWDGEKGKNALRQLAHIIEAFSAGLNGNPSQITEQILEEHRAQRDHQMRMEEDREQGRIRLEEAMQDQEFRLEMQELEQDFTREMAQFDDLNERERMRLADWLNREMARLERELGDAAFKTQLAATLANSEELKRLVERDPARWARLARAINGVDPGTHGLNNVATAVTTAQGLTSLGRQFF